jgi:hypothetical protein
MITWLLLGLAFVLIPEGNAADRPTPTPKLQELPEPPPMDNPPAAGAATETAPSADIPSETPEPEVTITTRGQDRYEEYRVRGQLYMIKVTPSVGKPYYLIDKEGKGDFMRSEFAPSVAVPMWVIKRF